MEASVILKNGMRDLWSRSGLNLYMTGKLADGMLPNAASVDR